MASKRQAASLTSEPHQTASQLMSVGPLLNRILSIEFRQEAGEGATLLQFRVLALLHEQPMNLSALAKLRRVSLQSAGELTQTLVERGWVIRTPDPADRRQSILSLTEEGRAHFEHAQDRMLARLTGHLSTLDSAQLETIRESLTILQQVLLLAQKADE